jgi:hypothetical protein
LFRTCLEACCESSRVSGNQSREDKGESYCGPDDNEKPPKAIEKPCRT